MILDIFYKPLMYKYNRSMARSRWVENLRLTVCHSGSKPGTTTLRIVLSGAAQRWSVGAFAPATLAHHQP